MNVFFDKPIVGIHCLLIPSMLEKYHVDQRSIAILSIKYLISHIFCTLKLYTKDMFMIR